MLNSKYSKDIRISLALLKLSQSISPKCPAEVGSGHGSNHVGGGEHFHPPKLGLNKEKHSKAH